MLVVNHHRTSFTTVKLVSWFLSALFRAFNIILETRQFRISSFLILNKENYYNL